MDSEEVEIRRLQQTALRRAKTYSAILGMVCAFAIVSMVYGYMQSIEAEMQQELAMKSKRAALIAQEDALRQRDRAEMATGKAKQLQRELDECRGRK